ncbi:Cu(I)-responsive transcriptional regulator (plasmid) [Paracoccus liaowanqingii]|uniref:Cu(I)-responsive transcriptional regulator n=1 Tax=Paracoccus liaowanqingii TaxID=2560053 RepID=A0A4Y5STI4_9RHOB|nr:Cu(I)-responsive transcriptional regulator [Paracoccus liaowanqingii]QDA36831.1 Cu(I)-responsive transcriptional regulator [Paracoccus liaowanqingii]
MNIGEAASQSGVTAKMIRYYEQIGLIPKAERTRTGYRDYTDPDVHMLRFIARARDLGFSIAGISELLDLWRNKDRRSADVKALAQARAQDLREKIAHLQDMAGTLEDLARTCAGNERPDCPILKDLAAQKAPTQGGRKHRNKSNTAIQERITS